jgi:hypothetical protein
VSSDTQGKNRWPRRRLGDVLVRHNEVVHPGERTGDATFVGLEHIEPNSGRRIGAVKESRLAPPPIQALRRAAGPPGRIPWVYLFKVDGQFRTSVIGLTVSPALLTRKRWPSGVTTNGLP